MKTAIAMLACASTGLVFWGCAKEDPVFTEEDGDTDSDTGLDTETGEDSDTGEDETPPELPASCSADAVNVALSGDGDGRWPALATSGAALLAAWAHDDQPGTADWNIRVAPHEQGAPPSFGQAVEPVAWSILSREPVLAARGDVFGLVWLDSSWDPDCEASSQQSCKREPAFIELTAAGLPVSGDDPLRLAAGAEPAGRPVIAPTAAGWVVAWTRNQGSIAATIEVLAIDGAGQPGEVYALCDEGAAAAAHRPSLAAAGGLVVAAWMDADQKAVRTRRIGANGAPQGEAVVAVEGSSVVRPRLAAGDDGFLLTYGRPRGADIEIRALLLGADGSPLGTEQRVTWTTGDTIHSHPAWNGSEWAVAWISSRANGTSECAVESCQPQVFLTALGADGAPRAREVRLSDDANPASEIVLDWDGGGWLAAFELRRNQRQQIHWGRAICD